MYSANIDGEPTTFGTSGMLYQSNKLMYDRATNSIWNQFTGEPVVGPLAQSGIRLSFFPSVLTVWEDWLAEHPDTTVISQETGLYPAQFYVNEWEPEAIYYNYFASPGTMFPVFNRDDSLRPKETVIGVSAGGRHKAYPITVFSSEPVINDEVGGCNVVVVASNLFGEARVYERGGRTFSGDPDGSVRDSGGALWTAGENALEESDGEDSLPRIPTVTSFWHGWFSFHPDTALYGEE